VGPVHLHPNAVAWVQWGEEGVLSKEQGHRGTLGSLQCIPQVAISHSLRELLFVILLIETLKNLPIHASRVSIKNWSCPLGVALSSTSVAALSSASTSATLPWGFPSSLLWSPVLLSPPSE